MNRAQSKELKHLMVFLFVVILSTALIWAALEFIYRKPVMQIKPVVKASRNLAVEQEQEVEKIPVVGENFETYQFKDPFLPLSKSNAPAENMAPSTSGGGSASTPTASNTAVSKRTGIQVIKISVIGNKAKASIRYNGKVLELYENQAAGSYTVADIDTSAKTVDFLNGDEKFTLRL